MHYFSYFSRLTNKTTVNLQKGDIFYFQGTPEYFQNQAFDFVGIIKICPIFDVSFDCMKKDFGSKL